MGIIEQVLTQVKAKIETLIAPILTLFAADSPASWRERLLEWWLYFWGYGAVVVSIFVLSYLIYKGYNAFVAAGSQELLYGILSIGLLYFFAAVLRLEFLLWLLDRIIPTLVVVLAVILQPELRRIFAQIGRQGKLHKLHRHHHQELKVIEEMVKACETLSDRGRGALIVFRRENMLRHIATTGVSLNAVPSAELIISLFGYDTPLHDGAIVLERSRILAAACILPIDPEEISMMTMKSGTRHRSAMGLARETDAVVLIVSEESGRISLAFDGQMRSHLSPIEIRQLLQRLLIKEKLEVQKWSRLRSLLQIVLVARDNKYTIEKKRRLSLKLGTSPEPQVSSVLGSDSTAETEPSTEITTESSAVLRN